MADPTRPEGERIVSVTVDRVPIDLAAGYRISSFSFLIQGGDNFREFANGTATVDTGRADVQRGRPAGADGVEHQPSLDSTENTSVTVTIGATDLGSFPVTDGSATVAIPAALVPAVAHTLTIN